MKSPLRGELGAASLHFATAVQAVMPPDAETEKPLFSPERPLDWKGKICDNKGVLEGFRIGRPRIRDKPPQPKRRRQNARTHRADIAVSVMLCEKKPRNRSRADCRNEERADAAIPKDGLVYQNRSGPGERPEWRSRAFCMIRSTGRQRKRQEANRKVKIVPKAGRAVGAFLGERVEPCERNTCWMI